MQYIICFLLIMGINSLDAEREESVGNPEIVITDEDIQKMKVNSVVELLNQIPGVSATASSVRFRGSSVKNILVLLDGRVINNPTSSYRAVNWSAISLNDIERIEIYKGTGSAIYGDNSSGGIISFTTNRVVKRFRSNIKASYGRFNSQNYDLNCQKNLRNLGLGLSASLEKTDGFRDNYDRDTKRVGAKLCHKLAQKRSMVLSSDYFQYNRGSPGTTYSLTPHAKANDKNWGITFLLPLSMLKSEMHYSNFEQRYKNPDANLENIMESQALNQALSTTLTAGRFGRFNIGVNLNFVKEDGNKITSQLNQRYAVYATRDIRLQKIPMNIGLGIRANLYSDFPTAINPQVQLDYKYNDFNIQLSASQSNNLPTLYQRCYETATFKPNPDLGMEKAANYSLSFSSLLKKSLEGSVSFFLNDINNRITSVRGNETATYKNIGSAIRKGIETSAKWKPNNIWQANISHTYLIAKDKTTGKYLTYCAKHRLNLNLQLKLFQDISFSLNTKYVSKMYADMENTKSLRGPYLKVDFKTNYSIKKMIRLFFNITNLLDIDYEWSYGEPASPRIWTVGMEYKY